MGGYRVNGCGWSDRLKTIRTLGTFYCPTCGKPTVFTLDKVSTKVDVLWIPTVTLKTKHAIVCSVCKNGKICPPEMVNKIIVHGLDELE